MPSSARTAPKRWPRRRPCAGSVPAFFAEHTLAELAGRSDYWLGQQGRLTHPMYRSAGSDRYRQISWDDAFAVIARELGALDSPDQAAF